MWDEEEFVEGYLEDDNNWEIRVNGDSYEFYETKDESIDSLISYMNDIVSLNDILCEIDIDDIKDEEDLYNYLMSVDSDLFEKIINIILEDNITIQLINLDGEEPSFGEL